MTYKLAIASHSLGRASVHDLETKLNQAAKYGYVGVEVFFEDLELIAKSCPGGFTPENQIRAAAHFKTLCDERRLEIMALQPFLMYEGMKDRDQQKRLIEKMKLWLKLAKILGTDVIQIPSNFLLDGSTTGDRDVIVADLREVCDLGLQETPIVRMAYEGMAWAPHVSSWEDVYNIVEAVDRPNFGMVLDTFHIAARVWGDPSSDGGKVSTGDQDLKSSLESLVERVDVNKILYIQLADAEFMDPPIQEGHPWQESSAHPPRMTWSRNGRLFPFEKGGYLPVMEMTKSIIEGLGYKGWISMELFSRSMAAEGNSVPEEHARRGREAWDKVKNSLRLEDSRP